MEDRLKPLLRVLLVLFGILLLRLVQLQVIQGRRYARLSERNHVRRIVLSGPRGRIFDRTGRLIADTRPSFTVSVIPTELNDTVVAVLAKILETKETDLKSRIRPHAFLSSPITIRRNLDFAAVQRLEENNFRLAGVRVSVDPIRFYPDGAAFCHVLGHLSEVSEADRAQDTTYRLLDYVGRDGIEARYERLLRGRDGYEYVEVDARGREVGTLVEKRPVLPVSGKDLRLTLDRRLQLRALQLTAGYQRCAVVGMNVKTGAILCLVSRPVFDPALFLSPIPAQTWAALSAGPAKPFFNRAVSAGYPPGSVLKPLVAMAALHRGVVGAQARFQPCNGSYKYGDRAFRCWSRHGSSDLSDAITHSCNVYFYQLGLQLGLDNLVSFISSFPLGRATGIDLPGENPGHLPSRAWLDSKYGRQKWGPGVLLNFAIGQGEILTTPLQLTLAYAGLANNGLFPRPHLLAAVDSAGRAIATSPVSADTLRFEPSELRRVKLAMERVVTYGTARAVRLAEIPIAGKTGTAENPGPDHAWFVGYAPADDPEIVLSVLIEHGGHGGAVAAPIASELIRTYFSPDETDPASPNPARDTQHPSPDTPPPAEEDETD